jgi:hypothetical protein
LVGGHLSVFLILFGSHFGCPETVRIGPNPRFAQSIAKITGKTPIRDRVSQNSAFGELNAPENTGARWLAPDVRRHIGPGNPRIMNRASLQIGERNLPLRIEILFKREYKYHINLLR